MEQPGNQKELSEQTRKEQVYENRKVHAENMRLKKLVNSLEHRVNDLEKFIQGGR